MTLSPPAPSSDATRVHFFVAGATGYVGQALVREARGRGIAVSAHVRPDSPSREAASERFLALGASVESVAWEGDALAAALARSRPTHVLFLVGTTFRRIVADRSRGTSYASVDLALLERMLAAVRGLEHPPRFVYLSSMGAGPRARGRYLLTRTRAEEAVLASGLPYTIARPPIITGPDREESRPMERLAGVVVSACARAGGLVLGAAFRDRWRPTDASELAHALVQAALAHTTIDRVLLAEELRWRTAVHRPDWAPLSRRDHGRH